MFGKLVSDQVVKWSQTEASESMLVDGGLSLPYVGEVSSPGVGSFERGTSENTNHSTHASTRESNFVATSLLRTPSSPESKSSLSSREFQGMVQRSVDQTPMHKRDQISTMPQRPKTQHEDSNICFFSSSACLRAPGLFRCPQLQHNFTNTCTQHNKQSVRQYVETL